MARRTNSPLKTLVLFTMVGALSWLAYEYLYVRKVLAGGRGPETVTYEERERIREGILAIFERDDCFGELGAMSYRFKEGQWRIDLEVPDGCTDAARDLCGRISEYVEDEFRISAAVWAFDRSGLNVGHHVP